VSEIEVFQFPVSGQQIRTILIDGEPWFVALDVAAALDLRDHRTSVALLDDDERHTVPVADTLGRRQQTIVVNEAGLYSMILRSRKAEAKAFKRWITHEVLPALLRTGRYEVAPTFAIPQSYAEALQLAANQAREIDDQRSRLAIAEPKAEYVDGFVNPNDDVSLIRVFAGQLGVGEKKLRDWLVARKLIYRREVSRRWSRSQNKVVPEYQWLAHADYKAWFVPRDQPEAPRLHNGQMATTLYITPVGKVGVRRLLMKHPIKGVA
jgi:anti-repressor protein